MASTINANTSGGLIYSGDTSGVLQLQTASTTALTVDTSANVGIGTASPSQKLSVAGLISSTGRNLAAGFFNSTNVTGVIVDATSADFYTNNAFAMGINSAGGVKVLNTLGVGNTTPSTSGAGITFPATQSASSDANTLDDYEEGTYTATMTPAGGSFTMDTARDTLQYVKIGRMVYIQGYIRTATVSSPTGTITINLPFTANAGTEFSGYTSGTVIPENITSGTSNGFGLIVGPSGSTATISYTAGGGTAASWDACAQKFTGNTNVTISLSYQASA
jgi:hypothetical protein